MASDFFGDVCLDVAHEFGDSAGRRADDEMTMIREEDEGVQCDVVALEGAGDDAANEVVDVG